MPVFIKQNIGGAYLVSVLVVLAAEALQRPSARAGFRRCLVGLSAALAIELVALQLVAGLDAFIRWAWTFAMSGRGVSLGRLREFADPLVLWPGAIIVVLIVLGRSLPPRARGPLFVAGLCAVGLSAAVYGGLGLNNPYLLRDLTAVAVGALAYGTLFVLVSLIINRSMVVCLLFAFAWETH